MKKVIGIICCIVCFSCNSNKEKPSDYDHIIKWNPQKISEELKSRVTYDYVILGNDSLKGFSGEISKIIVKDDLYVVLDGNQVKKRISIFDEFGNFINQIDKEGRGPGEYLTLKDISIKGDTIFALDNANESKVLKYDFNGNFIQTVSFSIPHLSALSATDFGYIGYRQMMGAGDEFNNEYAIYYFDHNGTLTDTLFPFQNVAPYIAHQNSFVENGRNLIFNQFFWNSIVKFDRKKQEYTTYYIDFANNNIPEDQWDQTTKILSEQSCHTQLGLKAQLMY